VGATRRRAHGVEWFSFTKPRGQIKKMARANKPHSPIPPLGQTPRAGGASIPDARAHVQEWKSQQKILWATVLEETKKLPGPTRGRDRTKIAELFADDRCSQAILDFLATKFIQCLRLGSFNWLS